MKWVKCLYNGSIYTNRLTREKIYEVLEVYNNDDSTSSIRIIMDDGVSNIFYMIGFEYAWFLDVTAEVRDKKINDILYEGKSI
jgi:hypothetical protein